MYHAIVLATQFSCRAQDKNDVIYGRRALKESFIIL